MIIIVIIVILKFLLPILYLQFPFAAGWANFVLDTVDGDILIPAGLSDATYQPIDKIADYVAYVFMFLWGWKQKIRREIAATFILRTVGQILFFVTNNEIVFFYFPNLLEPLFLIYVTIARVKGWDKVHEIYVRRAWPIWLFIFAYKLQDEYFTHVANIDRSEFFQRLIGG